MRAADGISFAIPGISSKQAGWRPRFRGLSRFLCQQKWDCPLCRENIEPGLPVLFCPLLGRGMANAVAMREGPRSKMGWAVKQPDGGNNENKAAERPWIMPREMTLWRTDAFTTDDPRAETLLPMHHCRDRPERHWRSQVAPGSNYPPWCCNRYGNEGARWVLPALHDCPA